MHWKFAKLIAHEVAGGWKRDCWAWWFRSGLFLDARELAPGYVLLDGWVMGVGGIWIELVLSARLQRLGFRRLERFWLGSTLTGVCRCLRTLIVRYC